MKASERISILEKKVELLLSALENLYVDYVGLDQYVKLDLETGKLELQIDEADLRTLREWCYYFGFDYSEPEEALRATLKAHREDSEFVAWKQVRDGEPPELDIPSDDDDAANEPEEEESLPSTSMEQIMDWAEQPTEDEPAPEQPVDDDADASDDCEEVELTIEEIMSMNWTALKGLADDIGLDYSDMAGPSTGELRKRILKELGAEEDDDESAPDTVDAPAVVEPVQEEDEDEEEGDGDTSDDADEGDDSGVNDEPDDDDGSVKEGTPIVVEHDGNEFEGYFMRFDDDGDVIFKWELEDEDEQCVEPDCVTVKG